jgi:hypothetical protein
MILAFRLAGLSALEWTMPLDARPLKATPRPQSSGRILRGPICHKPSNEKTPGFGSRGFCSVAFPAGNTMSRGLSRFLPEI